MKQKRFKSILAFLFVLCMVFDMQANIVFAQGNDGSDDTANVTDVTDTTDTTNVTDTETDDTKDTDRVDTAETDDTKDTNSEDTTETDGESQNLNRGIAPASVDDNPEITPQTGDTMSGSCGTTENDNVTWKLEQNNEDSGNPTYTLTISGTAAMADFFTSNEDTRPWKEYADSITNVEISEGVTSIGNSAFRNLTALKTANIPASITDLGDYIFRGDTSLTTVNWAEGFKAPTTITDTDSNSGNYTGTYVPTSMFDGCSSLGDNVELSNWLPSSFTGVGCAAFRGTKFTVNFDALSNLNYIGAYAFSEMPNLDSFTLTDRITIGLRGGMSNAFTKSGLKSLTIDVETVPGYFAYSAQELAKIVLTDKVTNINNGAFNSTAITELVIPSGVKKLGNWAFVNCSYLKKLTLLGEITLEGVQFPGTPLEELVIGENAVVTCTDDPFRATGSYPAVTSLKKVSILGTFISSSTDTDTKTFWRCFSRNADLTEIVLSGKNATNFSQSAFPNVTTLSILGGEATFTGYTLGDSKLEKVTIDVNKYSSESGSFRYAKNLKTFRLKADSANLDNRAFVECPSLVAVDLTECDSITYGDNTFGSMTTEGQHNEPMSHTAIIYVSSTSANPKKAKNKAGLNDSHGIVAVTNGGTFPENIEFTANTLATPTKAKSKFLGWYDNEECTGTAVITPEAGKTYYGKWIAKPASTISFKDSLKLDKTYDGNAVSLSADDYTVTGDNREVTFSYQVKDGNDWKDIDTAPTNAGTYQVKATVAEDDTYASAETDDWKEFTISKANPAYTVPTNLTVVVGQTLADVTLPGGFTWQDDTTTSVGNAGTHTFKATYTPTDTDNYNTVNDIEITLIVNPKKVEVPKKPAPTPEGPGDDGGPFTKDECGNVFDRWENKIYEAKGCNVKGYKLVQTSVID